MYKDLIRLTDRYNTLYNQFDKSFNVEYIRNRIEQLHSDIFDMNVMEYMKDVNRILIESIQNSDHESWTQITELLMELILEQINELDYFDVHPDIDLIKIFFRDIERI